MKTTTKFFAFLTFAASSLGLAHAALTNEHTLTHDNRVRQYNVYTADDFTGDTISPLIISLHGYQEDIAWMQNYSEFDQVADTSNCLVVIPQALDDDQGNSAWRAFGIVPEGDSIDDIGFINCLIDTLIRDYNVDTNRIYCIGESNGGFFTYTLASRLSHRIAAVANVAGSMVNESIMEYPVLHPTPVLHIHGTVDGSVPYQGNQSLLSIPDIALHWAEINNCDLTPLTGRLPNSNTNDGTDVSYIKYLNGDHGSKVVILRVNGGIHAWPGNPFLTNANKDIKSAAEAWNFFYGYRLDSLSREIPAATVSSIPVTASNNTFQVHPNPTNGNLHVKLSNENISNYSIYTMTGQILQNGQLNSGSSRLNLEHLEDGTYILMIGTQYQKVIINRR